MADVLELEDLAVDCVIGDLPEERVREQRLTLNVALEIDLARAAASDDLADTVDYAALAAKIRDGLRAAKCRLVERAADLVCRLCLEDARVKRASVSVRKSGCVPSLGAAVARLSRSSR